LVHVIITLAAIVAVAPAAAAGCIAHG
jgi:hypothetical protein